MATKGKTEKELWQALEGLDADLLDPGLPESAVDDELKALGVDPLALAKRASEFVAVVKEEERLSWQERAQQSRARLEALAAGSKANVPSDMGRQAMLLRLDELRKTDPERRHGDQDGCPQAEARGIYRRRAEGPLGGDGSSAGDRGLRAGVNADAS
jgi:hypothetical protein